MPMLISKFHYLIQSRITWYVVLVIIVFSFVLWGTPFLFTGSAEAGGIEGRLNGREIRHGEFIRALQHVRLAVALSSGGRMPAVDEQTEPLLRRMTWRRIAALERARRLGLTVGDAEVLDAVRAQPLFQRGEQFNPEAYHNFVHGYLAEQGLTEDFFLEHVRQELLLQRLYMATVQAVLAPPADLQRVFSLLEDRWHIEYAAVDLNRLVPTVDLTDEQIREYYQRNQPRYEVPPRMIVEYVFFDHRKYLDSVPAPSSDDIEDYYDEHRSEFTEVVSSPPASDTTNAPTPTTRVRPLEEVRSNIVVALRVRMAMDRAEQAAHEFVARISPDRPEPPLSFAEAARQFQLTVQTTPPLFRNVPLATVDAGLEFNRAAFELRDTPEERFSMPVRGRTGYYVLHFKEFLPSRIPELSEVLSEVRADAIEEAREERARQLSQSLVEALNQGRTNLADLARSWNVPLQSVADFSATSMPTNHPLVEHLMPELATCNPGEHAVAVGPQQTRIFARILARTPAPPGRLVDMSRSIADFILRERETAVQRAFEEEWLREGRFEDLRASSTRRPEDKSDRT
jgi:hypothetical protein